MSTAKRERAAAKRASRQWRPHSNIAAGRGQVLAIAARECGLSLTTVPVKHSRFMPETETEKKWLDTFTYCADPATAPVDERQPVDRTAYAAAQDPRCAAIFGS